MFDCIIVDESHHLGAPTWQHIKEELYSNVEWSTTEAGWRNTKRKPYLVCLTGEPCGRGCVCVWGWNGGGDVLGCCLCLLAAAS